MSYSLNYEDFDNKTQEFIDKVISVFIALKDKNIIFKRSLTNATLKDIYSSTDFDKKFIALFIAGFLVDGSLKNTLSQFDVFELDNFLDCAGLKKEDIKTLNINYEEYYNIHFKSYLFSFLKKMEKDYVINNVSPSLFLYSAINENKMFLNHFIDTYDKNMKYISFVFHPLKKDLEKHLIFCATIDIKEKNKSTNRDYFNNNYNDLLFSIFGTKNIKNNENEEENDTIESKKKNSFTIDDNLWSIAEELKRKFVGQEAFCEDLFYNIVNNQVLADLDEIPSSQRSLIFLDGPSGTGKTAITKDITDKLSIPFTSTSITKYSSTGYVGGDLSDILVNLYKEANGDLEKAQRGIVVIDEIDKIAFNKGGLQMNNAVQHQLLDFLGGGVYDINVSGRLFPNIVKFDTSKLTFVCLGALTNLRSKKTMKKNTIGFNQTSQDTNTVDYSITPQDLISIGLQKELVGRFNTYLHTEDYSKDALKQILLKSSISPLIGFRKWVESFNKELIIEDDVYDIIAEQAYELNTGARSLETVMNSIRTRYLKEVIRGKETTIYLDAETINLAHTQSMTRKERK